MDGFTNDSRANILENLQRCQSIIRRASKQGAKMVFLPEASDFIAPPTSYSSLVTSLDDSLFVQGIQISARQHNCWISVGVHEKNPKDPTRCYNTSLIISDQGKIEQTYQKLHLFDLDLDQDTNANESKYITPGEQLPRPYPTPIGKVGQLICYDLRFPEPAIVHRQRGAEILIYPSAFTIRTGASHWECLLRARAIETQCYVIAAAQVGTHLDDQSPDHHHHHHPHLFRQSWGHAMIIDPWGTILGQVPDSIPPSRSPTILQPSSSSLITSNKERVDQHQHQQSEEEDCHQEWSTSFSIVDIDLSRLERLRMSMPLINQRRHDIYGILG